MQGHTCSDAPRYPLWMGAGVSEGVGAEGKSKLLTSASHFVVPVSSTRGSCLNTPSRKCWPPGGLSRGQGSTCVHEANITVWYHALYDIQPPLLLPCDKPAPPARCPITPLVIFPFPPPFGFEIQISTQRQKGARTRFSHTHPRTSAPDQPTTCQFPAAVVPCSAPNRPVPVPTGPPPPTSLGYHENAPPRSSFFRVAVDGNCD